MTPLQTHLASMEEVALEHTGDDFHLLRSSGSYQTEHARDLS